MNQTNLTISPWQTYVDAQTFSTTLCSWLTLTFSIVQVGILSFILVREQVAGRGSKRSTFCSLLLRPINSLLLILILSNYLCVLSVQMEGNGMYGSIEVTIWNTSASFFAAIYGTAVIHITWIRGYPIVEVAAKWSIFCCRSAIVVFLLLLWSCFILDVLVDITQLPPVCFLAIFYLTIAMDVLFLVFDLFLLLVFLSYLRSAIRDRLETAHGRMSIMAKFGIAALLVFQMAQISVVAFNYVNAPTVPEVSLDLFLVLFNFQQYWPVPHAFVLLAMKWALHADRQRTLSEVDNKDSEKKKASNTDRIK